MPTVHCGHSGDRPHAVHYGQWQYGLVAAGLGGLVSGLDDGVDVAGAPGELVEQGRLRGVAADEGTGDKADPEHDRQSSGD